MAKLKPVTKLVRSERAPAHPAPDPAEPGSAPAGPAEVPAPRADPDLAVRTAIARELDLCPDDVTDEVHLQIDLGVDDAQLPQLLNAMGEALDVRFPDDFFDGVSTVAQLTAAVRVSLSPL